MGGEEIGEANVGIPPAASTERVEISEEALLLVFLREHDAACPLCKYNLRHLTRPRCPECGRELKLTVGMVEPFLAAWIMLTVGVSAASGIGVLLGAYSLRFMPHFPRWVSYLVWWLFIASTPLTPAAIMLRRRIQRCPRAAQWIMALLGSAWSASLIVAFVFYIR